MGLLSSIGNFVSNIGSSVLKGVESAVGSVAQSVGSTAIKALESVFDGGVGSLTKGIQGLVPNLPGPLSFLSDGLKSLIGKGGQAVSNAGNSGIESFIQSLVNAIQGKQVQTPSGTTTVNTPSLPSRSTTQAAATAAAAATAGSYAAGAPSSAVQGNNPADAAANAAAGLHWPAFPSDPNDPGAMAKYQAEMQKVSLMLNMYTQVMSLVHDTGKQIAQNIRA